MDGRTEALIEMRESVLKTMKRGISKELSYVGPKQGLNLSFFLGDSEPQSAALACRLAISRRASLTSEG